MLALALGAITLQPAAAETAELPVCTMTTPRGDNLGFFLWGDPAPNQMRMSSMPGSAWPAGTVVAAQPEGASSTRFILGGQRGLIFELSASVQGRAQRAATLFHGENGRPTVPVAYGFCQDQQVTANPPEPHANREAVGADHAAFDSTQWPDADCGLLLSDGRRIRFDPTLQFRSEDLEFTSADLWSGHPRSVRVRFSTSSGTQVGHFGDRDGPQGVRVLIVDRRRAAELYRFQELGDPAVAGVSGYGICGHRRIERRPNL